MKLFRLGRRSPGAKGQSLAEFALFLPILILLMLAIGELARIYSTMIAVESAAREAADFGSSPPNAPGKWTVDTYLGTVAEMERRACTPTRGLTEYAGGTDGTTCTNPGFSCELFLPTSGSWLGCANSAEAEICSALGGADVVPCRVRVILTYTYDTIAPTELLGMPTSFTFTRTSIFNIADFDQNNGGGS